MAPVTSPFLWEWVCRSVFGGGMCSRLERVRAHTGVCAAASSPEKSGPASGGNPILLTSWPVCSEEESGAALMNTHAESMS